MIFFVTKIVKNIYIPKSLRHRVLLWYHEYLVHPGQTRTEKTIRNIPWHGLILHKMLKIYFLRSICQVFQMTKKERKKYGLLPPKIEESDTVSLVHDLCGSGGSIYNKDTSQNTLSARTHNDRSRCQIKVGLRMSKPQMS
jgi:hypothetical protein